MNKTQDSRLRQYASPRHARLKEGTADPRSVITFDRARFTVLTDRMLRLEWAEDGAFEDRATLAVSNRRLPAVPFRVKTSGRRIEIRTAALTLAFHADGKPFSAGNLSVAFRLNGRKVTWTPGKQDPGNLKGTYRTLDGCLSDHHMDWHPDAPLTQGRAVDLGTGLISRSGWAVVDDSANTVLDASGGEPWVTPRPPGTRQDLYLLAYGHDYKAALRHGASVFGRPPLPPRYAFGYWWSRYWAYTDRELEDLVRQFNAMQVPLDVFVIDMDWHLDGWTGYTWDRRFFPDPPDFLRWLKRNDLKITLNLHPADGVGRHEEAFLPMCKAMGLDPKKTDCVPCDITDPRYVDAYFKHLHHPHEDAGVDFWWMDWQQGTQTKMPGLDPLPWINHLHWADMERRDPRKRPLIFSRFGGMGAGRFPVGFSGDVFIDWSSFAFQPYFTATAANVLFGYWSHDIGGHMPMKGDTGMRTDPAYPELYLRWVQFGIFSPVLRTHTTKHPDAERRAWEQPGPYNRHMTDVIRQRYELVPYIYTEARRGCDTALSLCRPLYHEWPEEPQAYTSPNQYLFGDSMMLAPVTTPVSAADDMAGVRAWLPPGEWYDVALGRTEQGGRTIQRRYLLQEIPRFVRAGAIVPGQQVPLRLRTGSYRDLVVTVYPGAAGAYELYEDDGVSQAYRQDECAWIPLSHRRQGRKHVITVGKSRGTFRGFLKQRSLEVRLPGTIPPATVKVGGRVLAWHHRLEREGWTYDGDTATILLRIRSFDVTRGIRVEVRYASGLALDAMDGWRGMMARLAGMHAQTCHGTDDRIRSEQRRIPSDASQVGNRISRDPRRIREELRRLDVLFARIPAAIRWMKSQKKPGESREQFIKAARFFKAALRVRRE